MIESGGFHRRIPYQLGIAVGRILQIIIVIRRGTDDKWVLMKVEIVRLVTDIWKWLLNSFMYENNSSISESDNRKIFQNLDKKLLRQNPSGAISRSVPHAHFNFGTIE